MFTVIPYLDYTRNAFWRRMNGSSTQCLTMLHFPQQHKSWSHWSNQGNCKSWELTATCTSKCADNVACTTGCHFHWNFPSCFGHTVQFAVGSAMRDYMRELSTGRLYRKILSDFSLSWNKKHDIAKAQSMSYTGLHEHSPITHCETRSALMQKTVARAFACQLEKPIPQGTE